MEDKSNLLHDYGSFFGKITKNELSEMIGEENYLDKNLEVYAEMEAPPDVK